MLYVGELVRERQGTRDAAVAEMAAAWGGAQRLAGPFLLVPYRTPAARDGALQGEAAATFLPVELRLTADLKTANSPVRLKLDRIKAGDQSTPMERLHFQAHAGPARAAHRAGQRRRAKTSAPKTQPASARGAASAAKQEASARGLAARPGPLDQPQRQCAILGS